MPGFRRRPGAASLGGGGGGVAARGGLCAAAAGGGGAEAEGEVFVLVRSWPAGSQCDSMVWERLKSSCP